MKKLILLLAMLFLGLVLVTSPAMAFSLPNNIPFKLKFNNWDYGTTYPADVNNVPDGTHSGNTDSYGVFSVTSITDLVGANLWSQTASEALEGWFYALSDDGQVLTSGSGNIWTMGGKLEIYLGARDLDPTVGPGTVPALGNAPTDIWNVTNGDLFLSADFVPGIVTGDSTTTYLQDITSITTPISGLGTGYLEVTGGSHAWLFDSDGMLGGAADLFLESDFRTGTPLDPDYGWTVVSHDPVLGHTVPEPASMLLLGSGLMGLAGWSRRKFSKKD